MGGPTKRMSMEEKRKVILDLYHTSKSVYTEKEILALAAKAGVNSSTVADIHAGLVDDCLVEKEKIGGSNYFWSFPAKADRQAQLEHQRTVQEIETLKQELEETQANLASAKRGREEDDDNDSNTDGPFDKENNNNNLEVSNSCGGGNAEDTPATSDDNNKNDELPQALPKTKRLKRSQKLARLAMVAKERAALETELKTLKENDPQALADLQHELTLVTQAANRWTDNIFNCQTYLVKKRNMNKKDVNRMLGITDSFDYPEDKVPK